MVETYTLAAKPFLVRDGKFKGELQSVAFFATSPTETIQWFVINCGQFEQAFGELISANSAADILDSLSRGEEVEFPGLYQREQFDRGFHFSQPRRPKPDRIPCVGDLSQAVGAAAWSRLVTA
jgi:hypothetical protein